MPLSDELEALAIASAMTLVAIAAMFVPIWYFEHRQGASIGRYTSRSFVHDVAYSVFYASGLSNLIGTAYLASGATRLEFLEWKLLAGLPTLVAAFLFWILSDLFLYWVHRAQHAIPWLWRLHSVHHATESLTFVTAHRVHPLENLWQNTVSVAPLLILGAPPKLWVPAFTTSHLPNGLELSVNPDNYLPMAAIAVGVRGGFLLDPPAKAPGRTIGVPEMRGLRGFFRLTERAPRRLSCGCRS